MKPTTSPTRADSAYAAGLVDGEGSVLISRRTDRQYGPTYLMGVHIANTYWPVLYWLQQRWGGAVGHNSTTIGRFGTRPVGQWIASARMAAVFLKDTLPYLQIKREAALNALAFQEGQPIGGRRPAGRLAEMERLWRIGQELRLRVVQPYTKKLEEQHG